MQRLKLRRAPAVRSSERDGHSLKFPVGGVFGTPLSGRSARPSGSTGGAQEPLDIGREIESTLDRMQQRLDEIKDEVDQVFHLPSGPAWPPAAA